MNRRLRPLPLLGAMLLLAACGGAATTAPEPSAAPATAVPTATPAPPAATPVPPAETAAPTPSAEVTAAPEQGVLVAPAAGFRMPLAADWVLLPLDDPQAALALLADDSQLRGVVESGLGAYVEAGMAGWAIDGEAAAGTITPNVNLIVREGLEIPGLEELAGAVTEELKAVPGVNGIDTAVIDLPIGPAVQSTYLGLGEGADAQAKGIQYVIPAGERLLVLSFTVPTNDAAREAAVEAMVAGATVAP